YVSTRAGVLLVSSAKGIVYSRDGGCTFTASAGAVANQPIYDIAADPSNPMRVLASSYSSDTTNGIYLSTDGGATFTPTGYAATNFAVQPPPTLIGVDPRDENKVYFYGNDGSGTEPLFASTDGGVTFTPSDGGWTLLYDGVFS